MRQRITNNLHQHNNSLDLTAKTAQFSSRLPHEGQRSLAKQCRQIAAVLRIILLFIIVVVNCLMLGYKMGRYIAGETENPLDDVHARANVSLIRAAKEANPVIPIVAFLRISKTGSTTLENFMNQETSLVGLYKQIGKQINEDNGIIGDCLYTHDRTVMNNRSTIAHVGSITNEVHQCFHGYYMRMTTQIDHLSKELQVNLRPRWVSMIRDPYDRLVSLFYFSKDNKMYPFSPKQWEMIENDDLQGWMESLTEPRSLWIPLQHMQFQDRVSNEELMWGHDRMDVWNTSYLEEAVAKIKGEQPIILTLLNECFEASLRLFVEEFGIRKRGVGGDDMDVIQNFVTSKKFHNRIRPQQYTNHQRDTDELRAKAKEWFRDDFRFFEEIVEQFKQKMEASVKKSGGDEKYFDSCEYY